MNINLTKQKLDIPSNFDFPFNPYPIQNDFMKNLYSVIENFNLGIFESPTGTGKSLSIICGALRWLKDHEKRERAEYETTIRQLQLEKQKVKSSDDNWLNSQAQEIELTKRLQQVELALSKIDENNKRIKNLKNKKGIISPTWFQQRTGNIEKTHNDYNIKNNEIDETEFLVEGNTDTDSEEEIYLKDEEKYESTKIYICSRTHSQLAQLVHEVNRSGYRDIRLITLASRQSYCINLDVNKLNNVSLINERCLELQKQNKFKTTAIDSEGQSVKRKHQEICKCPYMQTKSIEDLRDSALLHVQDVEQLFISGKKLNACPYYAARSAVTDAQVVILPYNLILHKSTREASGIKLKNNVIIIDEAHNLLEALSDMYSAHVTGHQLIHAHSHLSEYRNQYRERFTAFNLLNINQLLFIIGKFIKMLGGKTGCASSEKLKEPSAKLYALQDFLTKSDIDNLNIHKLLKFCIKSKICQKLNGFAAKFQSVVNINEKKSKTGVKAFLKEISNKNKIPDILIENENSEENIPKNPVLSVVGFLEALTHRCEDGRVICIKQCTVGKGTLKFLLLDPSSHFKELVSEARSIIVAGGTMQPISEFKKRLFLSAGASNERIVEFCCDHIVPPENILPIALLSGPTGQELDFSFGSRNSLQMLFELGRVLQNICSVVSGGIVCFFSSYDYENKVYNHLDQTKVLQSLIEKKNVFREPKLSSDVDSVLTQYAKAVKNCSTGKSGALLFSVVGGKLSEGLNFSDDLGRCIIVVGLPYPNIKSPELQEKMTYLDNNMGPSSGNAYYEGLCMKSVNQCIGRSVRHRNDYACVLLLDKRYSRLKIQLALPNWIQRSLVTENKFGLAVANMSKVCMRLLHFRNYI